MSHRATQAKATLTRCAAMLLRHRRRAAAGVAVALAGFGVTAVAIAPLASVEPTPPESRVVTESLRPPGLEAQLEALAARSLRLTRSDLTRAGDTAETLLRRLDVSDARAAAFLRGDASARSLFTGRGGKMLSAEIDPEGSLLRLVARFPSESAEQRLTHFTRLTVERNADATWHSRIEHAELGRTPRLAAGKVRHSLFAATDEAGIPDAVAIQLAEIFASEIDFRRELRRGDSFQVVYEALAADGEPVAWSEGAGRVLAAEFINAGREHRAFWHDGPQGKGDYFGADGRSKRRSYLASPLEFSRVSSAFAMRMHPLLNQWRQHRGVDYAAPAGTVVRAIADGIVEKAGWQSGYGQAVQLRHGNGHESLYAHLSRIAVTPGQRVQLGRAVGAVGATGWATGPHLHFEFKVNGVQQDPMRVARAAEAVALPPDQRPAFEAQARQLQGKLDLAETLGALRASAD